MKMSELSRVTAVPVATLKFYLREGLLHAGTATAKTQATYDDSHVERVRLIRALGEVGGLSLAAIGRVLAEIEHPETERLGVLGAAQRSLSDPGVDADTVSGAPGDTLDVATGSVAEASRAHAWLARRGWRVDAADPLIADLDRAWTACDHAGIGLDEDRLDGYGAAVEQIAAIDLASVPADPQAAVRQVVLGTVLVDRVLAVLRRLAQQHAAVSTLLPSAATSAPAGEQATAVPAPAGEQATAVPAPAGEQATAVPAPAPGDQATAVPATAVPATVPDPDTDAG